ncbi:MAG: RhuM family protein, partial [Candidatus Tenebribacter davisii]|nr:RhuM family protein [Candidatus Tenebribacter davisii]
PMYMNDWIKQLDVFLKMTNKDILNSLGTISHQQALERAISEFDIYKEKIKNRITQVEKDFVKQIEATAKRLKNE